MRDVGFDVMDSGEINSGSRVARKFVEIFESKLIEDLLDAYVVVVNEKWERPEQQEIVCSSLAIE